MTKGIKLQSAMEYLMTYGWSILIIAVVLGALFQLGVFSSSSFSVKEPPGACKVIRLGGTANLVGQCSGVLPQYVSLFKAVTLQYISAGNTLQLTPPVFTGVAWVNAPSVSANGAMVFSRHDGGALGAYYVSVVSASQINVVVINSLASRVDCLSTTLNNNILGAWHQVGFTFDGTNVRVYEDGSLLRTCPLSGTLNPYVNPFVIGNYYASGGFDSNYQFIGNIANIQIYNSTLSTADVQTLYLEGIGGVPLYPTNIVSWWPLNGNANDYGGNNNGASVSTSYTSQYGK
jgi:hypothetical protein